MITTYDLRDALIHLLDIGHEKPTDIHGRLTNVKGYIAEGDAIYRQNLKCGHENMDVSRLIAFRKQLRLRVSKSNGTARCAVSHELQIPDNSLCQSGIGANDRPASIVLQTMVEHPMPILGT